MTKRLFFLFLIILSFFSCEQQNNLSLNIATAANMQFAMAEIVPAFTKETGIDCNIILSSSGKLTAQIKAAAPFDVFLSADMKFPNELYQSGFCLDPPKIYAYGNLVLMTTDTTIAPSIASLSSKTTKRIALANPKTAPYGAAAMEAIKHYELFQDIEHKLVYGESLAQTNQFIFSQAVQLGFTAKSVVLSSALKTKVRWTSLDSSSYRPIEQGVVLLNNRTQLSKEAKQFYDFLFSAKSKAILQSYGYDVNN